MSTVQEDLAVKIKELGWFDDQIIYIDGLPEKPEEACCVKAFAGDPERMQTNRNSSWTFWPIEISVRANLPSIARERMLAVCQHLDGLVNLTINGNRFRSIFLSEAPTIRQREPGGRATYAAAFNVTRRGI